MNNLLIKIGLSIIMGIIFFYNYGIKIEALYILMTLILLFIIFNIINNSKIEILIYLLFFLISGVLVFINLNGSNLTKFNNKSVEIQGVIIENNSKSDYSKTYIMNVSRMYTKNKVFKLNEKSILKIREESTLNIGDKIKCRVKVTLPNKNTNPKLFNYRLYLKTKKIYTVLKVEDDIELVSFNNISKFKRISINLSNEIKNTLDKTLNENNSNVMKAIFFGEDSYIDDNTLEMYRKLGIAHILAVSGLHIGIISGFLFIILKLLNINIRYSIIISTLLVWIYGYLINYPISVLRALIMFSVLGISRVIFKRYDILNALFLSLVILLFINPISLLSLSFQLSFIIVFSLIAFTNKISKYLRINNKIFKLLYPLLAIQIGLIPVMSYYFNEISLISIFSNLIIIPILSFIIIVTFIMIFIGFVSITTAKLLGVVVNILLNITEHISIYIYDNIRLYFKVASMSILEILMYFTLILIAFNIINIKRINEKVKKVIYMYIALIILFSNIFNIFNETVTIQFIDVGQGDCTLIKYSDKTFLIDTGGNQNSSFSVGENIIIPYLYKHKISRLDAVFISHFDYDHVGALPYIIDNIPIDKLFVGYVNLEKGITREIVETAHVNNVEIELLDENNKIKVDNNFNITVLNPGKNKDLTDNNLSLVLLLKAYDKHILFTGDIEKDIEYSIKEKINTSIDIIKVPHHGSNTSSTEAFVKKINPSYAVISVGINNYNHPSYKVIDRYLNNNTNILRTDNDGMVIAYITDKDIKMYKYLNEKLKYDKIYIMYYVSYILISILLLLKYKYIKKVELK